jgi:integrase
MEVIKEFVKKQKPEISEKTLHGYALCLNQLYRKIFPDDKDIDMSKFFEHPVEFYVDWVNAQGKSKSFIRNMLSSIQVVLKDKNLTKAITNNSDKEKEEALNPEATPYVKEHHLTQEQIDAKYNELKTIADGLWDKNPWTMDDFMNLQKYVMFSLVCGKFIAPRRSKDWYMFKLRNIDLEKDNYLDGRLLIFNSYKTAKATGQQRIPCPPELYRILRKWIRFNKLPWLFVTVKLEPLTAVTFNQKLNNIMGIPSGESAGWSTNSFRHIYLTNKFSNTLDLKQEMESMGSSVSVAHLYIKKI